MNEVSFTLSQMHVTKEDLPADDISFLAKPVWSVSYSCKCYRFLTVKWSIHITMAFTLKDNGKQIASLEMWNIFIVSGDFSEKAKLQMMTILFEHTAANLQGIWAAKTEKQPTLPVPPFVVGDRFIKQLKKDIAIEWV